jgi:DNA-binding protein HU-beta
MATKPMTKAQLVAALADEAGMDKKSAAGALDALTAIVTREVAGGGAVNLPGIGKFECRHRPERMVRVVGTGQQVAKPADKTVKVTVSKSLKDGINA